MNAISSSSSYPSSYTSSSSPSAVTTSSTDPSSSNPAVTNSTDNSTQNTNNIVALELQEALDGVQDPSV